MNSEFIQPFIEAAIAAFEQSTQSKVGRGPIKLQQSPMPTRGVASFIGIMGKVEGRLLLDLSRDTACKLTARLNGQESAEYDELVISTINELANIIGGRAVSALVNKGYKLEITPPTLFSGNDMEVSNFTMETVVIPIETEFGLVNVNLALKV